MEAHRICSGRSISHDDRSLMWKQVLDEANHSFIMDNESLVATVSEIIRGRPADDISVNAPFFGKGMFYFSMLISLLGLCERSL